MADAVTYAELKISDPAAKEARPGDAILEHHTEDRDVIYENVDGLDSPRENKKRGLSPNPKPGSPGLRKRSYHPCLVLMLLCLALSAAVIGLAVKYIQVSSHLQHAETSHQAQGSKMAKAISNQEDRLESVIKKLETTKAELEKTRLKLKQVDMDNMALNMTLLQCQREEQACTANGLALEEKLRDMEKMLEDTRSTLAKAKDERQKDLDLLMEMQSKDLCPKGWVLFRNKCLWFSAYSRSWERSKDDCELKKSNLIIVQEDDTALKDFLSKKQDDFWVGKEWNKHAKAWRWPYESYYSSSSYCWQISRGKLHRYNCDEWNRWICEKNLVVASWKESSVHGLEFTLWDSDIWCHSEN